jgi:uncharacterized RDD family membrane protein YckC
MTASTQTDIDAHESTLRAPQGLSTSTKKPFSIRSASSVATLDEPTWLSAGEFENLPTANTDWVAAEASTPRETATPWRHVPVEWAQATNQTVRPARSTHVTARPTGTSLPSGVTVKSVLKIRRPIPERARLARRVYAGLADLVSTIGVMWAADEVLGTESILTNVRAGVTAGGLADRGVNTVEVVILRHRPIEVWAIMAAWVLCNSVIMLAMTGRSLGRWLAGITMKDRMTLRPPGFARAVTHLLFAPLAPFMYWVARRTELQATPTDRLSNTVTLSD